MDAFQKTLKHKLKAFLKKENCLVPFFNNFHKFSLYSNKDFTPYFNHYSSSKNLARYMIIEAFNFSKTPQGFLFWNKINNKWMRYIKNLVREP